ncbi:unnamed protein product [Calypogeia fissa]
MATALDVFTQWTKLLPTGTFLTFKTLSSIMTNNGKCDATEQALTGTTIFLFSLGTAILTFTDSYVAEDQRLYYGIATRKGLWNPVFYNSGLHDVTGSTYMGGGSTYLVKGRDFVNAILAVLAFATLALLSQQSVECFYGIAPTDVRRAVPIVVAVIVCFIFALSPPARNGVGYAVALDG